MIYLVSYSQWAMTRWLERHYDWLLERGFNRPTAASLTAIAVKNL